MGKNTMMRKAIRGHLETNPALERLLPHIKGNVGLVFTKGELTEVRDKILVQKVAAPAKAGVIAPLDVVLPGQNTGLGPEKTSFFQALAIPTKITKGTIEILVSTQAEFSVYCGVQLDWIINHGNVSFRNIECWSGQIITIMEEFNTDIFE